MSAIERHGGIVDDKRKYQAVDQAHSLKANRKNSLPYDEARLSFSSHLSRLTNMDKTRLSDEEKKVIDIRRAAFNIERQTRSLGVDREKSKKQGQKQ